MKRFSKEKTFPNNPGSALLPALLITKVLRLPGLIKVECWKIGRTPKVMASNAVMSANLWIISLPVRLAMKFKNKANAPKPSASLVAPDSIEPSKSARAKPICSGFQNNTAAITISATAYLRKFFAGFGALTALDTEIFFETTLTESNSCVILINRGR